jgi:hypothetical protein
MHGTPNIGMKQKLLSVLRRALGTDRLDERLASLQNQINAVQLQAAEAKPETPPPAVSLQEEIGALRARIEDMGKYQMLPGTASSRYALPLETAPSRHLRPRWGNMQPPIAPLLDWVSRRAPDYREMLATMRHRAPKLAEIRREFVPDQLPEPGWVGGPCSAFDAAALYTMIGEKTPKRYVEIGSGVATAFARRSVQDHGLDTHIVAIDPEPQAGIDAICDAVVRRGLEACDLSLFDQLEPGDILFLDGSHHTFMNSDATVFMIDVLPRLKPGVLVQIHEIYLPWDYPDWFSHRYWSEAYLVAAYLIAARDRVQPILPTAWVTRTAQFSDWFETPLVDLGDANGGWRKGAALWFTHTA